MKELVSTNFLGLPLVVWGGLLTLSLLVIQVLIGYRLIKVDFKYHKVLAIVLIIAALFHGSAALIFVLN